jgi:hypothetical protein
LRKPDPGAKRAPGNPIEDFLMLGHMVYFTLKDRSPASIDAMVADCRTFLSGHPGTVFFAAGTLVADLTRAVNQTDFDVALQILFEDRRAHDHYQAHPRHVQFIEKNKPNWDKVRVFDADVS